MTMEMLQEAVAKVPSLSKDIYYLGGGVIAYLILEKTYNFVKFLLSKNKAKDGNGNGNGKVKLNDTKVIAVESAFEERKEADKEWRDDVRDRFDKLEGTVSQTNRELGEVSTKMDTILRGLADVKKNCAERLATCERRFGKP